MLDSPIHFFWGWGFKTGILCVAALDVLHSPCKPGCLKLIEIHLPLPPKCMPPNSPFTFY